jgi:hypothetical protein
VARRRRGAAPVLVRPRASLRSGAAPRRRPRRDGRRRRSRARCGCGQLRRHRPDGRKGSLDRDGRRLHRHARPSRLVCRDPRRSRRRRAGRGDRRSERRRRAERALCLLRAAQDVRPAGVCRSRAVPAGPDGPDAGRTARRPSARTCADGRAAGRSAVDRRRRGAGRGVAGASRRRERRAGCGREPRASTRVRARPGPRAAPRNGRNAARRPCRAPRDALTQRRDADEAFRADCRRRCAPARIGCPGGAAAHADGALAGRPHPARRARLRLRPAPRKAARRPTYHG